MTAFAILLFQVATMSAAGIQDFTEAEVAKILELSPLPAPPSDPTNRHYEDSFAADLGKKLFFDSRFSNDGNTSCATCHHPEKAWSDGGHSLAQGKTTRRAPSLMNVPFYRWYFWDGRADSLWGQALGPLENANENGCHRLKAYCIISEDPELRRLYTLGFGTLQQLPSELGTTSELRLYEQSLRNLSSSGRIVVNQVFVNLAKALAAFERTLVFQDSPFDDFVRRIREGKTLPKAILSDSALQGLKLFIGRGNCLTCHQGPLFSDGEFHNLSLPEKGLEPPKDPGRYEGISRLLTSQFNSQGHYSDAALGEVAVEKDLRYLEARPEFWGQFKTPSLRNLAGRSPYMHSGIFASLEDVIEFYSSLKDASASGHHDEQVLQPLQLTATEKQDLLSFLQSLNSGPVTSK